MEEECVAFLQQKAELLLQQGIAPNRPGERGGKLPNLEVIPGKHGTNREGTMRNYPGLS